MTRSRPQNAIYRSFDGKVELVVNEVDFDVHLTTHPDYRPDDVVRFLDIAAGLGYIPDDGEWPEMNEDGTITGYLRPVVPVPDLIHEHNGHRPLGALAAMAALAMAAFVPHMLNAAQVLS